MGCGGKLWFAEGVPLARASSDAATGGVAPARAKLIAKSDWSLSWPECRYAAWSLAMCVVLGVPGVAQVPDGGGKLTAAEAAARFGSREGIQHIESVTRRSARRHHRPRQRYGRSIIANGRPNRRRRIDLRVQSSPGKARRAWTAVTGRSPSGSCAASMAASKAADGTAWLEASLRERCRWRSSTR